MRGQKRASGLSRLHLLVGLFVFVPVAFALVILAVVIVNTLRNGQLTTLTVALVMLVVANLIIYVGMNALSE